MAHVGLGSWGTQDGPYSHHYDYDQYGNLTFREGWGGTNPAYTLGYTNNRLNAFTYDATGNLTDAGGGWTFTYDAEGQQASSAAYNVQQYYDGDRLRAKKVENGTATYYLRSSVLGGQVVAEMNGGATWQRGYVYLGGELLAVQQDGVYWMHQDPVAKSKRVTDGSGNVVSAIELDPWGGETNRSSSEVFQPHKFTSYERDVNGSDDAMHRRYNRWWSRFEQPDPYDGSYSLTDPQSFNRYAYTQNDPVNFIDPTGFAGEFTCTPGDSMCGVGSVTVFGSFGRLFGGGPGGGGGRDLADELLVDVGIGGASIDPQEPRPAPTPDPCAERLLVPFDLRDAGGEANINLIHNSVSDDFLNALLEINDVVPGGISFRDVFRDSAMQARRRAAWEARRPGANPARRAGTSSHEAGMAVDVAIGDVNQDVINIFANHGWVRPFPDEPWHFEADTFNATLIRPAQNYYNHCVQH